MQAVDPGVDADVYGRGIAFPPRIGLRGFVRSGGPDRVTESIRIILGTRHGERAMRPTFGCELGSLLFAPNTAGTAALARYYVEDALRRWEPRIELLDVTVTNDPAEGKLLVDLTYRLRATQEVRTLAYDLNLAS